MKRFLGTIFFVAFALMLWGQDSGNPFDLKFRSPKAPNKTVSPKPSHPDSSLGIIQPGAHTIQSPTTGLPDSVSVLQTFNNIPVDSTESHQIQNPFELGGEPDSGATPILNAVVAEPDEKEVEKTSSPVFAYKSSKGFQIFFVLFSLLFLIFIVNVERSYVRDLWRVISNENYSSLHHRNQRNTMRQILLLMGYAVFIIQAGLFLFNVLRIRQVEGTLFDNIWISIGFVLIIYLSRHSMIRYLRWLFNNEKEMTLFGFDISIFNIMVGLVLLPVNILILFGPESMYNPLIIIGVVAIVGAYLLRQLRWLLTARQLIAHSLFLFFVYLCAVEILPLWAVSKLFW